VQICEREGGTVECEDGTDGVGKFSEIRVRSDCSSDVEESDIF